MASFFSAQFLIGLTTAYDLFKKFAFQKENACRICNLPHFFARRHLSHRFCGWNYVIDKNREIPTFKNEIS
jgi:hypothetical protein